MSLRTRNFREAEWRAALVDDVFPTALMRAREAVDGGKADLNAVLRGYLREALEDDLAHRLRARPGRPVFGGKLDKARDATDVDADTLAFLLSDAREALANRDTASVAHIASCLLAAHGLPDELRQRLALGVLEANVTLLETAERRTLGTEPMVFRLDGAPDAAPSPPPAALPPPAPEAPPKPPASALVEGFFERRTRRDQATGKQTEMERGTLRRFLEACGDKAPDAYSRRDVNGFLNTLRRLPTTYGKSPRDKDRSLAEIIAAADAAKAPRLTDRTAQRHLTALAQFFQYAVDEARLSVAGRAELVSDHRFREDKGAREQRDALAPEELATLFGSPVWTGCHPHFRDQPGPAVVRDGFFWLPLLALYHGARLEELADLRRCDVARLDSVWFLNITDEARRLKNGNAKRRVPLHPEIVRVGFLDHVQETAPEPNAPLFPDLTPRGKDKRRGVDVTKRFTRYRRKIGLGRDGLSFHSFRHTAITRLSDAITTEQQRRHRDRMMGHGGSKGSEGDIRYDKGPGLKAMADTLSLLSYPELDLFPLYPAGKELRGGGHPAHLILGASTTPGPT